MPYSPLAAANYFIERSLRLGKPLTPLQLMKLVYLAHGWHMAAFDSELLTEAVQAWKYGPVVTSLYHRFKKYGSGPITAQEYEFTAGGSVLPRVPENTSAANVLDAVWNGYSDLSGPQLSTLTHQEGSPWRDVVSQHGDKIERSMIIPNQLIRAYFKNQLAHATGQPAAAAPEPEPSPAA